MAIEALAKPAGHGARTAGRATAARSMPTGRPSAALRCLWLVNELLDRHWKPSRSRLVLTTSEDGIEVRCDPGFPDAWRKEPFRSEIRQWALSGETHDVTVVVIVGSA